MQLWQTLVCSNCSQGFALARWGTPCLTHGPACRPPDGRNRLLSNNCIFFDLHKEQLHFSPLKMIDSAEYIEGNSHFLKAVFSFYTWSFLFCLSLLWFSSCAREIYFNFPLVSVIAVNSVKFQLSSVKQKHNITQVDCSIVQALCCSIWNELNTCNVFKIHVYIDFFFHWIILGISVPFSSVPSPPRMKRGCSRMQKQHDIVMALKRKSWIL